jgi:hypothetical protein
MLYAQEMNQEAYRISAQKCIYTSDRIGLDRIGCGLDEMCGYARYNIRGMGQG